MPVLFGLGWLAFTQLIFFFFCLRPFSSNSVSQLLNSLWDIDFRSVLFLLIVRLRINVPRLKAPLVKKERYEGD